MLAGMTLFLVLVVLPRRYVLSAGLRESGVSFPSEAAPFSPPEGQFTQAPPLPPPAAEPIRGPAEIFWHDVEGLLDSGRYREAIPVFEKYLRAHPGDRGVFKEYAITLDRAGFKAEAVMAFEQYLSKHNDPGVRLLLARALRDRGRLNEASFHYGILLEESPAETELTLEWGQALAWEKEYPKAVRVLTRGLDRDSASVDLKIALAQVHYWSGDLDEADRILGQLDHETLKASGVLQLRSEVTAALTPPEAEVEDEPSPAPPPTLWERIVLAEADEDYRTAAALFQDFLRESPDDTAAWRSYADLLQFQLEDLEGARSALLRLESTGVDDLAFQFRQAQLDLWTGREVQAGVRLNDLLSDLELGSQETRPGQGTVFGPKEVAEVYAVLGDLRRWAGDRAISGESYVLALETDSYNTRAKMGLEELSALAEEEIEESEAPGLAGNAYSIADSDEFTRLDLGVDGKTINDHWVWGFRSGTRWLGGFDLAGGTHEDQGLFLELESARWWRWGTIRTGVHLGLEETGPDGTDITFGASLRFSGLGGFRTDIRFDHGPAYPLTMTLQSIQGGVTQDRVTVNAARSLGERWSLSLAGDAAWLSSTPPGGQGEDGTLRPEDGSLRLEAGASLGRAFSDEVILGVNARAVGYSAPSPLVDDLRLFWDPEAVFSWGIYGQLDTDLSDAIELRARVNPSIALINERTIEGFQAVPHLSAEAGVSHQTDRFRTSLDAFYYQGRFDGYKAYGLRLSVSARNWLRKGGGP
jgi:Flp pilus assembly protein TadD